MYFEIRIFLALILLGSASACSAASDGNAATHDVHDAGSDAVQPESGADAEVDAGTPDELDVALVTDLNTDSNVAFPGRFVEWKSKVWFATTTESGAALVASDGTKAGTKLAVSLPEGVSQPVPLAALEDALFFSAFDDVHGNAIWKTDGTEAGTSLWFEGLGVTTWGPPTAIGAMGDHVYFSMLVGSAYLMYRTDATAPEAELVSLVSVARTKIVGSRLFFVPSTGTPEAGQELWVTDGTPGGTHVVKDVFPGATSSQPILLDAIGSTLFFFADDGVHGSELWKTDGTEAGTLLVNDIYPGQADGAFTLALGQSLATALGDRLIFVAKIPGSGFEPMQSDGTAAGTKLLANLNAGTADSHPTNFVTAGAHAYFYADDGVHGSELWKTDGTAAGTQLVKDIAPGSEKSSIRQLTSLNGKLFFDADDGVHGDEPWSSDGTVIGTKLIADITTGAAGSNLTQLSGIGELAFFACVTNSSAGAVCASDGTASGTVELPSFGASTADARVSFLHRIGERVFFIAEAKQGVKQLYATDGTEAGTHVLTTGCIEQGGGALGNVLELGDKAFFAGCDAEHGRELWVSDGTLAGTSLLKELAPGTTSGSSSTLYGIAAGDELYFAGSDPIHGLELWKTDGTAAGTQLVADTNPGTGTGCIFNQPMAVMFEGSLYFTGTDDGSHRAVFRAEPSGAVTRITPINFSAASFLPFGDTLYFYGGTFPLDPHDVPTIPLGVYRTDGTLASTQLVFAGSPTASADLGGSVVLGNYEAVTAWDGAANAPSPVVSSSVLGNFVPLGDGAFFIGGNTTNGFGAWFTNGKSDGTLLLHALKPVSFPVPSITAWQDRVYFSGGDAAHGTEMWSSDGTAEGTWLAADIAPGAHSANPASIVVLGEQLLFAADDGKHGMELMRAKRSP